MTHSYRLKAEDVARGLATEISRGLDSREAARRLVQFGPNQLKEKPPKSAWRILAEQLSGVLILVLIGACLVSLLLGEYQDAAAILVILVINAALGVRQEVKAEQALAALKKLAVPRVRVLRDGEVREVSARDLVPGDVVLLEAGSLVPADGRLAEAAALLVDESTLTGESEPAEKRTGPVTGEQEPALGDRFNMAYMGTTAAAGRGKLVVTATGMDTELGRIAHLLAKVTPGPTPLQRRLDRLGSRLAASAFAIVGVIFLLGLLRGESLRPLFLTAVSLAVAAVPEGLPAVVAIALALGAQRMLKRHALIRKLPAVETLGSVTVICSDKTGTLTENRMTVTVLDAAGRRLDLTERLHRAEAVSVLDAAGHRFEPSEGLRRAGAVSVLDAAGHRFEPSEGLRRAKPEMEETPLGTEAPSPAGPLAVLLAGLALCNDARLARPRPGEGSLLRAMGDPTEAALVVAAARLGFHQDDLEGILPRLAELPFDPGRKRMTTLHPAPAGDVPFRVAPGLRDLIAWAAGAGPGACLSFTKGTADGILERSVSAWSEDGPQPLTAARREAILASQGEMAGQGMRVLALACRRHHGPLPALTEESERDLVFVGLAGMMDPPRAEVAEAVALCSSAGIRPVMITGDHPLTALHVARRLGMAGDGRVLSGPELSQMGGEALRAEVERTSVYARVSPEHKLLIVSALQDAGHVVAMTGDGVNDAPALKRADIGVAMGVTGTDVAKEASDMVLLDDNFATIVAAVREGRVIFDNIRKFVKYMIASNSGEILVMLLAPLAGMPLPLFPLQLLWINLLTDGLPAVALGVEPAERGVMERPPFRPGESVFSRGIGAHVLWVGALMGLLSFAVGFLSFQAKSPSWRTMLFTAVTFCQMAHVLAVRPGKESLFRVGLLSNPPLAGAVLLTVVLQLAVVYLPVLGGIFRTLPLSMRELFACIGVSSLIFLAVEGEKWLQRRR